MTPRPNQGSERGLAHDDKNPDSGLDEPGKAEDSED